MKTLGCKSPACRASGAIKSPYKGFMGSPSQMDKLAFIANRSQWISFSKRGDLLEGCVVASMDFEVTMELKDKKIPVIDLFKYLDGPVTARIWAEAHSLCEAFANSFRGRVLYRGCDIISLTQGDLETLFVYYLTSYHVASKALEEFSPRRVVHFAEMRHFTFADPPDPPPDIFNAVTAHCAILKGISVWPLRMLSDSKEDKPRHVIPDVSKTDVWPHFLKVTENQPIVAFCGDYREQQLFVEEAARQNRTDLVLILAEPVGRLPWLSMYTALALRFDTNQYRKKWRESLFEGCSALGNQLPRLGEALRSPLFAFFWDRYLDHLLASARYYALGLFLGQTLSPKLLITSYDWFGAIRCLQQTAKVKGASIVSVDHVGMSNLYSERRNRNAFSDVLVWGEHEREGQLRWRDETASVHVVGSLRRDHAELSVSQTADHAGTRGVDLVAKQPLKVVLFTTRLTSAFGTSVGTFAYRDSWRQVIELCGRHADWDVIVKPHPNYDYYSFYRTFSYSCPGNLRVVYGRPRDILPGADAAVLHNCPSTAALDAIGMNVPVVYLRDAVLRELPPSPFERYGLILVADTVAEVEDHILSLLARNGYRENVLNKQKEFFSRIIAATGDEAVAKMNCVVEKVASYGKKDSCREGGLALFNFVLIIDAVRFSRLQWCDCWRLLEEVCPQLPTSDPQSFGFTCFADLGEEMLVAILYSVTKKYSFLNLYRLLGVFRIVPKEYRPKASGIRNVLARGCLYLHMSRNWHPLLRVILKAMLSFLDKDGSLIEAQSWR